MEGLSKHPSNEGGTVYLTLHGVAVDPSCLAGGDVRGEAEAGGEALGHRIGVGCFGIVARIRQRMPLPSA